MTSRHGARLAVSLTKRVKEEPSRAIVKRRRHLRRFSEGRARARKRTCSLEASSRGVPSSSSGSGSSCRKSTSHAATAASASRRAAPSADRGAGETVDGRPRELSQGAASSYAMLDDEVATASAAALPNAACMCSFDAAAVGAASALLLTSRLPTPLTTLLRSIAAVLSPPDRACHRVSASLDGMALCTLRQSAKENLPGCEVSLAARKATFLMSSGLISSSMSASVGGFAGVEASAPMMDSQ